MPVSRLARLGDFAFRRRRLVLGAWVGALVAAFALSATFGGRSAPTTTRPDRSPRRPLMRCGALPGDVAGHGRRRVANRDGTPTAFLREAAHAPWPRARGPPQVSPDGAVAVARLPLTMLPDEVPRSTGERLLELGGDSARRIGRRGDPAGAAGPDLQRGLASVAGSSC